MSDPDQVSGVFAKPFAEQVAYFRQKLGNLVPTERWDDMLREEHDAGFMVAGATKADLLSDLAAAVDKAISEGRGLEEFRRDFRDIVRRNGWTGWTGEGSVKGEAWRVKTILRTNAMTSYAAGRLAQLRAGGFPLWVYRHGDSREPRVEHLSWDGMILPADHKFWNQHYPPSDWGCSCYVMGANSEAGAKRVGGVPGKTLPANWQRIDPKTGEPVGIGKGWGYAPGASVVDKVNALTASLNRLPPELATAVVREWGSRGLFEKWAKAADAMPGVDDQGWPLVRITTSDAEAIGSRQTYALLSPDTWQKQQERHPELRPADYLAAQAVIDAPTIQIKDGERALIFVRDRPGNGDDPGYVVVIKATRSGAGLFITSMRKLSRDAARNDREVQRLLAKGKE